MSENKQTPPTVKNTSKKSANVNKALQNFSSRPSVEPPKKSKNWVSLVLLPIVIALGLYFMIQLVSDINKAEGTWSINDLIRNINVKYLFVMFAAIIFVMLLESVKYLIVTHAVTGKLRPLDSIKVAFVGKYYDDITPFSAGGQPMQIVYLHKKGHSTGTSSAIILIKYFIQMMCWVSICFFLMILNRGVLDKYVTGELYGIPTKQMLVIAGWIGWAVNAILPCSIVFFAIFPKFTNKVLEGCINIVINISWRAANRRERKTGKSQHGRKIKLIRRKRKWIDNANSAVADFRSSFIVMAHKPLHFISLVVSCIAEQLVTWAFPFIVLIAFDKGFVPSAEIALAIMALNVYTAMTVTVVPTPGNSGLMEIVMGVALSAILGAASVWVLVGWRMSTYYIYILIGMGITIFEFVRKLVRNKRESLKPVAVPINAEAESTAADKTDETK